MKLQEKITLLKKISEQATSVEDSWSSLILDGNCYSDAFLDVEQLLESFDQDGKSGLCQIFFDGEKVIKEDLSLYSKPGSFNKLRINVNKNGLLEHNLNSTGNINFFISSTLCEEWFTKLDSLVENSPLFKFSPLSIIVPDLDKPFGNPNLCFVPAQDASLGKNENHNLPTKEKTSESIHFITDNKIALSPQLFLTSEKSTSQLFNIYLRHASISLSCCIVNEFYNKDKVVIDGIRRVALKVYNDQDTFDYAQYDLLVRVVSWIYEDRIATRRKLFNDRLTLDIDESQTLSSNIKNFAEAALQQAKERYNFVISERKDAYVKELKDLLKDLRSQSDLYSQKIRVLLSNFLRDLLASVVLVGFTIFTKFSDNLQLNKHQLLTYVFWGLGIYYIASILLQSITDIVDISVTKRELRYWKKASNELLPEREFDNHYRESLRGRRRSLRLLYPFIASLYLVVSFACFKYPYIFEKLVEENEREKKEQCF